MGSIGVLARTKWGLGAARRLLAAGRKIELVATTSAEEFYGCSVFEYERFATECGARFVDASRLSSAELCAVIDQTACQVAISINWPRVLGADIIHRFPLGVINAHAGDLPRYRGNACPNWAILNGEPHIGLSAHLMDAGALDSGPIVLKEFLALTEDTYIGDVYEWLDKRVPIILAEAALGLLNGECKSIPQSTDSTLALRCYPRRPEDGRIEWRTSAMQIRRLIRASARPFAGAFAFMLDGRRVNIWRASPFNHPGPFCAVPGQIMLRDDGCPVVACGEGCLRIEEAEIDGDAATNALAELGRSLRARLR